MVKINFKNNQLVIDKVDCVDYAKNNNSVNRIFAIDCSGSMSSDLTLIRDQLKNKIPTMINNSDTVTIIWFSGKNQCGVLQEGVKVKSLEDLNALFKAIDTFLKPISLTGFKEPLLLTKDVIQRLESKYTNSVSSLIFMTDGYDNQWSEKEILDATSTLSELCASVTFIEYGWSCNRSLMNKMADSSSGVLIFNENFYEYNESIISHFSKDVNSKKIEVKIYDDVKDNIIYGLDESDDIITYFKSNESVLVKQNTNNICYFVNNAINDDNTLYIEQIKSDSNTMGIIYKLLSNLTQKMKSDLIFDIISSVGDIHLYNKFINCYSKQDYSYFQKNCLNLSNDINSRFIDGRNPNFIPKDDAFTVIDLVDVLASDYNNKILIYSDEFDYNKISLSKKQKTELLSSDSKDEIISKLNTLNNINDIKDVKLLLEKSIESCKQELVFTPNESYKTDGVHIDELVYNKNRPNISFKFKIYGTVDLSCYTDKSELIPDVFDTFIYRNYTIVNDGIKNIKKLPCIVSETTKNILDSNDVKYTSYDNGLIIIDIESIPLLNRKNAINISADAFFKLNIELLQNSAIQKVLKYYNSKINQKVSSTYISLYGEDVTNWLKNIGLTEYSGFSPAMESVEPTDEYIGKSMNVSIKSCSSLPSVDSVLQKIESNKKLTKSENIIKQGLDMYNEFINSSIYIKSSNKENLLSCWLSDETKNAISVNRKIIKDIAFNKFALMIGHTWFTEFESLDDNSMNVEYNNEIFECKAELTDLVIKI